VIGKRIKQIRNKLNISQKNFASELSTSAPKLSNYENGKYGVKTDMLEILYIKFNINLNWLVTGKGNMTVNSEDNSISVTGHVAKGTNINVGDNSNFNINNIEDERLLKLCEEVEKLKPKQIEKLFYMAKLENLENDN